ncbi:MAG: hypothetical protein KC910_21745 [Candidatus Eremiobacteraeota bacterium]|nr:hypothetical protein [Candidatus Eremiobacteraeota bacterium]
MKIAAATVQPRLAPSHTVVSAYIDGKASGIEKQVLRGIDQFERAYQKADSELTVVVDGQRRSKSSGKQMGALLMAAPLVAGTLVGAVAGAQFGMFAGMALAPVTLLTGYSMYSAASAAPNWEAGARYTIGQGSAPTPVAESGVNRLHDLVVANAKAYPTSRHVIYLSGHGEHDEVAGMKFKDLAATMGDTKVDVTVLDACLTSQLEAMTRLAPWAGVVLASSHVVPAKGLPIEDLFSHKNLAAEDLGDWAASAEKGAFSLAAIDTRALQSELLPSLDKLGGLLSRELESGHRADIRRALARSKSPGWFFTERVDMSSFLDKLEQAPLSEVTQKAVANAKEAMKKTVLHQKNAHSFTFALDRDRNDQTMPPGWRNFLDSADYGRKPLWPY